MIVDNGRYYLYRHIRLDKNEPFYIGIGKKQYRKDCVNATFARSQSRKDRNIFWDRVTSKTNYLTEILYESDNRDFIQEKEREFIKLYGRRDLGSGTLVNLTDGGDNGLNRSAYAIQKQISTSKANGSYQKMCNRIREYAPKRGEKQEKSARKTFLYKTDGSFVKEFRTRDDCAAYIKTHSEVITRMVRLNDSHNEFIASKYYLGEIADLSKFKIKRSKKQPVYKICPLSNCITDEFESIVLAAKNVNRNKTNIHSSCKYGHKSGGYFWRYKFQNK